MIVGVRAHQLPEVWGKPATWVPVPDGDMDQRLERAGATHGWGDVPLPKPALDGPEPDIACILQTSGTEGAPKVVPIARTAFAAHRKATAQRIGCGSDSVWGLCLPMHHIGGVALMDRAHHGLGTMQTAPKQTPDQMMAWLEGITHVSLVPTQLKRLVHEEPPASLRCALIGGDRLSPDLALQAMDAGWPIFASYGMTETCSQVATATPEQLQADPTTVGRPLDGVNISIESPDARGIGRIVVAGPTVTGGRFRTGDLGRLSQGQLFIHGRVGDRIITGGENVDPQELEARLDVDACFVGLPDDDWGQRVVAVVAQDAHVSAVETASRSWARHERPKAIVAWGGPLPRTPGGKLLRRDVLARIQATSPA